MKKGGIKLKGKWLVSLSLSLLLILSIYSLSPAEEKPKAQMKTQSPITKMTKSMSNRLSTGLHVKNVVGDPVKVGKMTIIPIIMMEVGFGGGGGGAIAGQAPAGSGFYMSGEAKPLGFVIISKAGVKFVSVGKVPRK